MWLNSARPARSSRPRCPWRSPCDDQRSGRARQSRPGYRVIVVFLGLRKAADDRPRRKRMSSLQPRHLVGRRLRARLGSRRRFAVPLVELGGVTPGALASPPASISSRIACTVARTSCSPVVGRFCGFLQILDGHLGHKSFPSLVDVGQQRRRDRGNIGDQQHDDQHDRTRRGTTRTAIFRTDSPVIPEIDEEIEPERRRDEADAQAR